MNALSFLRGERARHRWIAPGVTLTAAAAFGSALPDLMALLQRVLS